MELADKEMIEFQAVETGTKESFYRQCEATPVVEAAASILLHLIVFSFLFVASLYPSNTQPVQTLPIIQVTLSPPHHSNARGMSPDPVTALPMAKHAESLHVVRDKYLSREGRIDKAASSGAEFQEQNQNKTAIPPIKDSALSQDEGRMTDADPAYPARGNAAMERQGSAEKGEDSAVSIIPRYLHAPHPNYPIPARLRGQEGQVLISVLVLADGQVGQVRIKRSSGYTLLDQSALTAIRSWRFEPVRTGNPSRPTTVDIPIRFTLKDRTP